jgi:hypothetical protein
MDCPACLDTVSPDFTTVLGECGHSLCRPCAVAVVHTGMEVGRPFPQCLVCVDEGSVSSSAYTFGKGWLSFEALNSLHVWSAQPEVVADGLLRGQQPISSLLVDRYCRAMLMAALSGAGPHLEPEASTERGRDDRLRRRRQLRQRRRNFGGGEDDEGVGGGSGGGGGGIRESKSGEEDGWGASGPPPAVRPSLHRALSVAMRCPNDACGVVLKVGASFDAGAEAGASDDDGAGLRQSCPYCGEGLCVLCGASWEGTTACGITHAGYRCDAFEAAKVWHTHTHRELQRSF